MEIYLRVIRRMSDGAVQNAVELTQMLRKALSILSSFALVNRANEDLAVYICWCIFGLGID
jgi:hypothetical protein